MVERKCANLPDDLRKKVLSLEDSFSFDTKTFRGILETNGMVCESGSDSDPKALFLEVSRFNHSCNANCDYSWRDRQNCMDIYAQTIIRAGEELCIPYIDLREPRQVRQQLLKENWRFRCRCEVCCLKDFSESDRRRLRLGELSALLYSSRTSGRTLRIAKKLLKLYNDEHISAQQGWIRLRCWVLGTMVLVVVPVPTGASLAGSTNYKISAQALYPHNSINILSIR